MRSTIPEVVFPPLETGRRNRRRGLLHPDLVPTQLVDRPYRCEEQKSIPSGRNRGWIVFWRLGRMVFLLLRGQSKGTLDAAGAGTLVRETFEQLGGVWIKLGQLIALRHDLLPGPFCLEVGRLHDEVKSFPGHEARRIIEEDLGRPLESVFSEFDDRPVAAASIGQCHKARLRGSGELVAVKVQRPEAASLFRSDMALVGRLFWFLQQFSGLSHFGWGDVWRELESIVEEELDYRFELAALQRVRRKLKRHRKIYAPRPYPRRSSRRVLVMEYIDGVFMTDYLSVLEKEPARLKRWLRTNRVVPRTVGHNLLVSYNRQLLEDHLFHGDLHPGNIVLLKKNWVCLIDFGTVGHIDVEFLQDYQEAMAALSSRNYDRAVDLAIKSFEALPPDIDLVEVKTKMVQVYREWDERTRIKGIPHGKKSLNNLGEELGQVLSKYRLTANWAFLRVNRAGTTLDVSLQKLLPKINYPKEMQQYLREAAERMAKRAGKGDPSQRRQVMIAGWLELFRRVPGQLGQALETLGGMLQRASTNFQATSGKLALAASYLFSTLFHKLVVITAVLCLATFIHQKLWTLRFLVSDGSQVDEIISSVPSLTLFDWLLVFLGCWYLNSMTRSMVSRLDQRSAGAPGLGLRL
ncbi:MAG: AarF/ABC1/UbiB kinase family protein [Candidatus Riflebacteria bacterium]|nr:AarF/ABC1/UbiB kinase family protein [Candidatus Riflebacteria bacterium]